jgi:hypothetical protein
MTPVVRNDYPPQSKGTFSVATAQVEVWVKVHQGSINGISATNGQSAADAALGRMMLYIRRAAAAEAINAFMATVGGRFAPGESRAPPARINPNEELAAAAEDCQIVVRELGLTPALLFERATLSEMTGRADEALEDLGQLLNDYPGFLQAAIADARLALAAGNPGRAIRSLAVVEGELSHTREGAMALADALRATGMHHAASRYDLIALLSLGHNDSRGNDCAPEDLAGNIATDVRMPPLAICIGKHDSGEPLCNERGVYYLAISRFGLLSAFFPEGSTFKTGASTARRSRSIARTKSLFGTTMDAPSWVSFATLRLVQWIPKAIRQPAKAFLLHLASKPKIRRLARKYVDNNLVLVQLPDHARFSPIVQSRLRSGIARIFGTDSNFDDRKLPAAADEIHLRLLRESSAYKQTSPQ